MSWGGSRPGAGRKAKPKLAAEPATKRNLRTVPSLEAIAQIIEASNARSRHKQHDPAFNPFQLPQHPPGAVPAKKLQMAMDESLSWAASQWAGGYLSGIASEGLSFLGYAYLSELSQRPEYRVFSETIATEMTRKWIKFSSTGAAKAAKAKKKADEAAEIDDGQAADFALSGEEQENKDTDKQDDEKTEKIKELVDFLDDLRVRDRFADLALQDGFFGRTHLYLDSGADDEEIKTPITSPGGKLLRGKVGRRFLKRLQVIEPVWTYPTTYNATDPRSPDWYNPQVWYVMGKEIHRSRMPTFIGRPVPDMLKPSYSFGGLSLSQMAKPYVDIWLTTRQSVGELIHAFSVMVLSTDLGTMLQPGGADNLLARAALFNALRDNQGLFIVNKATEDFKNVSASIAGLHELQAQAQEHMMAVGRIPAVKFTGIQPAGLNASSEGELRAFYDTIGAFQGKFFKPNLDYLIDVAMVTLWGKRDPEIVYEFEPLWELSEKEKSEKRKADAETGQIHIDTGVLSPEEERKRIAADPENPYHGLDPEDVPDLLEEEEQGLEPEGGRPDPKSEGEPDASEGGPSAEANDAEFNEADHPRAPDGKFGSGGSSSGELSGGGPSNREKIKNAAAMYGEGSKQHKEARRRFGAGAKEESREEGRRYAENLTKE